MDPRLTPDARTAVLTDLHQLIDTLPREVLAPLARLLEQVQRELTPAPGEPPAP